MPMRCSVVGCPTRSLKGSGPRFFCIPSEINFSGKASPLRISRRKKWIAVLKLQHLEDFQLKNVRICGLHFVTGKPAEQYYVHHPDWVPSLFLNPSNSTAATLAKMNFNKMDVPVKEQMTSSAKNHLPIVDFMETLIEDESPVEESSKYSMPQKRCCMVSCLNRMSKTKSASPPIYYHKFPENPITRHRWVSLTQKKGTWDPDQCYICSEHFLPEDYVIDAELKPLSVPTVNLLPKKLDSSTNPRDKETSVIFLECKAGVCSVPGCKTKRSDGKRMEPFPEELEAQRTWINSIYGARVPLLPSPHCLVCQDHFKDAYWIKSDDIVNLKKDAVPTIFNSFSSVHSSIIKKKSETVKDNHIKCKNLVLLTEDNLKKTKETSNVTRTERKLNKSSTKDSFVNGTEENNIEQELEKMCDDGSDTLTSEQFNVVRVVKRQFLSDHTYSGMDSSEDDFNLTEIGENKKRKIDTNAVKGVTMHKDGDKLENISSKRQSPSEIGESYEKNVQDLIADLMDDGNATITNISETTEITLDKTAPSIRNSQDQTESSDDYSDYSDTDSDPEPDDSGSKALDKMSFEELKELSDAQKYQLDDLKSENNELIKENDKLRNALSLLESSPENIDQNLQKKSLMHLLAKMFRNFLNEDQILNLIKSANPSTVIVWTGETLNKALKIHTTCSEQGYDQLLQFGYPLPPLRLLKMLIRNRNVLDE